MAKFDPKKAREEAATTKPVASGTHTARVLTVVDVGFAPPFPGEDPKESHAIQLQLATGQTLVKVMRNSAHASSLMGGLLAAAGDDVEEMAQLVGRVVSVEVEENGRFPRVKGFYALSDGMSDPVETWPEAELLAIVPGDDEEAVDPVKHRDALKRLPEEIRKAFFYKPKGSR
jgi:hypothetical protein